MTKFKPRQRKHKVNLRGHRSVALVGCDDSSAIETLTGTDAQKGAQRTIVDRIPINASSAMPSQKRKRLDKYIENKLRKEENAELIRKLAAAKCDTSRLKSSKSLGGGKGTNHSAFSQATKAHDDEFEGFDNNDGFQSQDHHSSEMKSDSDASDSSSSKEEPSDVIPCSALSNFVSLLLVEALPAESLGTGLKRPLELDGNGYPVVQRRKRLRENASQTHLGRSVPFSEGLRGAEELSQEPADDDDHHRRQLQSESLDAATTSSSSHVDLWDYSDSETSSCENQVLEPQRLREVDPYDMLIASPEYQDDEAMSSSGSNSTSVSTESGRQVLGTHNVFPEEPSKDSHRRRSQVFKAWASEEANEDMGGRNLPTLSSIPATIMTQGAKVQRRNDFDDPLPPELQITDGGSRRKLFNVQVERLPKYQESRMSLPVVAEEHRIMEAIHNNPIVIIWGATGSGKTTQVPQFLYEAGFGSPESLTPGMIGITQPRRVAAVSSANRVSHEVGTASDRVSYQIRFDSTVSDKTAIKYMTDGILVREITQDFTLAKYSAIIIDEAHERSVNTDILIGMLTRVVYLRNKVTTEGKSNPLKLIIMSATLSVSDFYSNKQLFPHALPPLIRAEGRQYPVTVHFARTTQRDYIEEVFKKICKGHRRLPPGGMLIFLTGQSEILALISRLRETLSRQRDAGRPQAEHFVAYNSPIDFDDPESTNDEVDGSGDGQVDEDDSVDIDNKDEFEIGDDAEASKDVTILPLYSQLPTKAQLRIFDTVSENTRLIVIATNVAETSLTIPGIRYVFDCGRSKEKKYDAITGVQTFEVGWISKASASQRAGRAGRTGPGHVYRLYSSAVYERDFEEHAKPEILRTPIEGIVLQLKSMKLSNIVNFPFPTPPDLGSLVKAEKLLVHLGSLTSEGNITKHGQELAKYPLSPRFAKMLCIGHQADCIYLTMAIVAVLVIQDIFISDRQLNLTADDTNLTRSNQVLGYKFSNLDREADFCKGLSAFAAYSWNIRSGKKARPEIFCDKYGLKLKALKEVEQLWHQLINVVSRIRPEVLATDHKIPAPSKRQIAALKQIVAAGFIDQIAIRADLAPNPLGLTRSPKRAIDVPYLTLFPSWEGKPMTVEEKAVFIHPTSILATRNIEELPHYIVYSHLQRASPSAVEGAKLPKVRMHPLTSVKANQIAFLAKGTHLVQYRQADLGRKGRGTGDRTVSLAEPELIGEKGSVPWPLPARLIAQKY